MYHLLRFATRFRDDRIRIRLRLILEAILVLARPLHVVEGIDHLCRRVGLLKANILDANSRSVRIEDCLQKLLRALFDLLASHGDGVVEGGLTNHFTHRALGGALNGRLRVTDVEQKCYRIADLPLHLEVHVDDILIAREDCALFGHVARHAAACARIGRSAVADVNPVDRFYLGCENLADRPWQIVFETRASNLKELAEDQLYALFARVDGVEAGCQPNRDDCENDQNHALGGRTATRNELPNPVLPFAQELLDVRRLPPATTSPMGSVHHRPMARHHYHSAKAYLLFPDVLFRRKIPATNASQARFH